MNILCTTYSNTTRGNVDVTLRVDGAQSGESDSKEEAQ